MAVIVRNCGCGCDLRTGVIIIALFYMVSSDFDWYNGAELLIFLAKFWKTFSLANKSITVVVS